MAGLARGMRPGRRRGGRTGRPMRQGPHPADTSRGALPRARRRASQDQKHVATHACRMPRKNRPAASRGCDFRRRQTTEKPKTRGHEKLRRSSVLFDSESHEPCNFAPGKLARKRVRALAKRLQLPSQCWCAKLQKMEGFFGASPPQGHASACSTRHGSKGSKIKDASSLFVRTIATAIDVLRACLRGEVACALPFDPLPPSDGARTRREMPRPLRVSRHTCSSATVHMRTRP